MSTPGADEATTPARWSDGIAIVGAAGRFPGAENLAALWQLVRSGRTAVAEVGPDRWVAPAQSFLDRSGKADSIASTRACLLDPFDVDLRGLSLDPVYVAQLDPLHQLALDVGGAAFRDAATRADRERTGVILANIVIPTEAAAEDAAELFGTVLESQLGLKLAARAAARLPDETRPMSLPAALLCRALGLGGGGYTLDAACASTLYAIHLACMELFAGRLDAALTGGLCRPQSLYTQIGMTQLQAISPSGRCSPFDSRADGLVVGEGAGIFVLRRLADAVASGETIHAVIRGIGLSNDVGGSLLSPESEGQLRAMRRAYAVAGWRPSEVDLIECHGTGTPRGDAVELGSLRMLLSDEPARERRCAIGSVKSNVGHLLTAAGAAALGKVLCALREQTLAPSANFKRETASPALSRDLFEVLEEAQPWPAEGGRPRRAAISGFGFGGINAHLLLEEWRPQEKVPRKLVSAGKRPTGAVAPVALVGMASHFGRLDSLRSFQHAILRGEPVLDPRPAERWRRIDVSSLPRGALPGAWVESISIDPTRFRIPPREVASLLPQQLLMLAVAADAIIDAGAAALPGVAPYARAGCIIGLGLDLETTTHQARWALRTRVGTAAKDLGETAAWLDAVCAAIGPGLDAARTLGSLGGIVPSRIARHLQLGGPSFAVGAGEASGLRALEVAARLLQRHEVDAMVVGAVDFTGDARAVRAANQLSRYSAAGRARPFDAESDGPTLGEGAAAVVLKRLDDALRAGDRIYAVVHGIGSSSGAARGPDVDAHVKALARAYREAEIEPSSVSLLESGASGDPLADRIEAEALLRFFPRVDPSCALGSAKEIIGETGAAAGLASLIKASLCLFQEILPPSPSLRTPVAGLPWDGGPFHFPREAQPWLRDRKAGPRRAGVSARSLDGTCMHAVLEAPPAVATEARNERARPLGPLPHALFLLRGDDTIQLEQERDRLREHVATAPDLDAAAARWHRRPSRGAFTRAFVADGPARLRALLDAPVTLPHRLEGELAVVFPGAGSSLTGLGLELGLAFPETVRRLDLETANLASQAQPSVTSPWRVSWPSGWREAADRALLEAPERALLAQVFHGLLVHEVLADLGVRPSAYIGYSLGESTALFAARAWQREEMFQRTLESPLFRSQLAGACEAARQAWNVLEPDWRVAVVSRPPDEVRSALWGSAALLIVNTPRECVIGGRQADVDATIAALSTEAVLLRGVPTVHCGLLEPLAAEYRAMHFLPTAATPGVRFYSGAWARSYRADAAQAADSILASGLRGFDFCATVERAWADGVRVFLEPGPQGSCARMIDRILADKPHLAISAHSLGTSELRALLEAIARLAEAGVPVDLDVLYRDAASSESAPAQPASSVEIKLGGPPLRAPVPRLKTAGFAERRSFHPARNEWLESSTLELLTVARAGAAAHHAYLQTAANAFQLHASALVEQQHLIKRLNGRLGAAPPALPSSPVRAEPGAKPTHRARATADVPRSLDRQACLEFAVGSIGRALGPGFAAVDAHPTRVRLPGEPLMLVDRILAIEGEPGSLGPGRVVTEHDVAANAWYLDGGRAPVGITVEAGQADLFLCAFLGIDAQTRGERVYRLLDAKIVFHRDLPRPGEILHYDIRIDRFLRQGDTWLFFFAYEGTIAGEPLLTMTEGCAGFFSSAQLTGGRGLVSTPRPIRDLEERRGAPLEPLIPLARERYDDVQLEALRRGDLAGCFGEGHSGHIPESARLPSGRLRLVDRIVEALGPAQGRIGVIVGEADISADSWFMTCHFSDDPVMPGTLMYEASLQTLRVLMLRWGCAAAIAGGSGWHWAPLPNVQGQLRCRGQVAPGARTVQYRIEVREIGLDPAPYAIADAILSCDGKPIVEIRDMSQRLVRDEQPARRTAVFGRDRILAHAIGRPSEAFGERYRVFDEQRRLARLPGPPFLFLDQVVLCEPAPWVLAPGGWVEAEYEIPPEAWYFAASGQRSLPFAVLLEIALQPCGWLASYAGSALASDEDLQFRNLDGTAKRLGDVGCASGLITTRVRLSKVSKAGAMILEQFEFEVLNEGRRIYAGTTGFGYFTKRALEQQVGLRNAELTAPARRGGGFAIAAPPPLRPSECEGTAPPVRSAGVPSRAFSFLDEVTTLDLEGGPQKLGYIAGRKRVDPGEWFFAAHFFQDPVMPGSLGLEAMLQLAHQLARARFPASVETHELEQMGRDREHRWTYRGQVLRDDKEILVAVAITSIEPGRDADEPLLMFDGTLAVDGRTIYAAHGFSVRLRRNGSA